MPLQSSGIIVVEKTSVIAGSGTTTTLTNNKSNLQQFYEFYDVNDGNVGNIITETNNNNGNSNISNNNPLMRRHQRTISSSSSSSIHSPSSTSIQQQQQQLKHHQVVTTNLQTLAYNQQQHQQTQQQQQQQQHHQQQQMNQLTQQQHHQQTSSSGTGGGQQLIVSEEYLEHAQNTGGNNASGKGGNGNGNVMISTTNDVLNQQIIKIVTAGGPTGNMIIDSMGNVTTTNGSGGTVGGNNNNSKVLFNNLTVMSKQANSAGTGGVQTTATSQLTQQQHHQQTINFVNAKSLPYITTTSKGQTTTLQKMTAYKTNSISIKQGNQPSQQQQHHVLTSTGRQTIIGNQQQQGQPQQQVVQKVTMPRNVQMVTRVQTMVTPQHSSQQQQQQQQHISSSGQMVMQQKYVHNIVNTGTANIGSGKTNLIKKTTGQSMKLQQHKIISTQQQPQGVKTFIQQQSSGCNNQQHYQTINLNQSQHQNTSAGITQTTLKHIKSQKIIKQYNNAITNSSGAVSVATLHHNHSVNTPSVSTSGTYTISNKINTAGVHQHLSTKLSKHSKYVMQNHIVIPSSQNQNHKVVNNAGGNSIMVNQQILNTISSCNNSSGTIKFVNAHGTVIQQQQQQQQPQQQQQQQQQHNQQQQQQAPTIITATTQKVRANSNSSGSNAGNTNHHYQHPQQVHITQQQFVTSADGTKSDSNNIYHISPNPSGNYIHNSGPAQQQSAQQNSPLHTDDIMIVNGTQMTDELSARILQSMAQKSFNNQQRFHQQQQHQPPTTSTKLIQQTSKMLPPAQLTVQQQHHASTSNLILSPKEYPVYGVQQQQYQQQQQQRLCNSAPNSRSQSLERKYHDTTISTKKSTTDYYKVKNDSMVSQQQIQQQHNLHQSSAAAMASRIPIGTTLTQHQHHQHQHQHQQQQQQQQPQHHSQQQQQQQHQLQQQQQQQHQQHQPTPQQYQQHQKRSSPSQADQDDELIGEEVRPIPVNTNDVRLQVLQAVLQDHTYVVAMPTRFPVDLPTASPVVPPTVVQQQTQISQQQQTSTISSAIAVISAPPVVGQSKSMSDTKVVYSTNLPNNAGGQVSQLSLSNVSIHNQQGSCNKSTYTMYGQQIAKPQQDDDAHSAISNGSTRVIGASGEIDPGEETETAPEAEAEDDSITRCVCDFTHDDGYMICCDKCSAWQHVDCMGIDRLKIPDDYLCELCEPREVDRARARSLQLQKRKEQTQMLLNATQMNSAGMSLIPNDPTKGGSNLGMQQQLGIASGLPGSGASQQLTKKGKNIKRKELVKKAKKEKTAGVTAAGKRRENKKTTKRKSKNNSGDPVDKHAANLRQWIENYELAVTNHYSPELRARLHAISKQPSLLHTITTRENKALKHCGSLENKATTVPHAGGKILISNFDIPPNSPIFELRGKYMLTTQYKNLNTTVNMNSPPPSNYLQTLKSHKIPGAFIFFYQMTGGGADSMPNGIEICVDTRTYGNEARFVRRSCRPNAVIQHLFEKGTIHLYIVSLTNIMASTEITIKHEPHDLLALENKKQYSFAIQPTSTSCACGLPKDCLFGVPIPISPAAAITITKPARNSSKVVLNGCVEKSAGATAASKKKAQNMNRGRSTSSSGESNAGLLSPNNNNNNNYAPNLYNSAASIASLMHDSGVYTSSSSPSVSIPSPPTTHISSPPVQPIQSVQIQSVQQLVPQSVQHVAHLKLTSPSMQPIHTLQQLTQLPQLQQPPLQLNNLPAPLLLPPPTQVTPVEKVPAPSIPVILQTSQESKPVEMLYQVSAAKPIVQREVNIEVLPPSLALQMQPHTPPQTPPHTPPHTPPQTPPHTPPETPPQIQPQTQQQAQPQTQTKPQTQVQSHPLVESEDMVEPPVVTPLVLEILPPAPAQVIVNVNAEGAPVVPTAPLEGTALCIAQQQNPQQQTNESLPDEIGSPVKSPQKPNCGRKTPAKQQRTSVSEDSTITNQQQTPTTPTATPQKQEEKRESRKLTREERKMEAILRAFEKMEKNQQRKQELKQAKTDVSKRRNSNSPSPKRSNSADGGPSNTSGQNSVKKNVSNSIRKKKRKSHKSYNINSQSQRKRRKSRMNSNDSEGAGTSEESSSMLSPTIQGLQNCKPPGGMPTPESVANRQSQLMSQLMEGGEPENRSPSDSANADAAAGLLLAFANPDKDNVPKDDEPMEDGLKTPERPDVSGDSHTISPPVTPTIVSSTCLLIEAAVGPLENLSESAGSSGEFKYPAQTKTKKVLMSNWLNQSSDFIPNQDPESVEAQSEFPGDIQQRCHLQEIQHQELQQSEQLPIDAPVQSVGLDSLVQAAMCDYGQVPVASPSYITHASNCEEPQNLSIVAKKVEEFINQSEATSNNIVAPPPPVAASIATPRNALTLPLQISTCSNNSSVKKRWLRQAISEETDESSTLTPLSGASPQLPNGFTTPLKKRRLVINSDGAATGEDFTPEDFSRSYAEQVGETSVKQEDICEFKEEPKQEVDMDDDVDILRSPSPGQKMVAEDNLVKIEPEDMTSGDDVRIDVEREESREGGGERFDFKEEIKQEENEISKIDVDCKMEMEVNNDTIVKMEKNEAEEQEHVEVEDHVKSEDEYIAVVDEPTPEISTNLSPSLVKVEIKPKIEEVAEIPNTETAQPVEVEEVKPLPMAVVRKSEEKKKNRLDGKHKERKSSSSSASTPPIVPKLDILAENENIPDELADIQERLHSFHKENIMILQSRNKKSKSPKHSSSTSTTTKVSHSLSQANSTKKTSSSSASKKPKKARKSSKGEAGTDKVSLSSSKTKSANKSSSSSATVEKEKGRKRHRTSSTSSTSSSKKRQLNFEHIDRVVGHHKRSNSTSSSKDECSAAKKRRESSRSDESQKCTGKAHKTSSVNSMALLPFQEQPTLFVHSQVASVPLPVPLPVPAPTTLVNQLQQITTALAPHTAVKEEHLHHSAMTIPSFNHPQVVAMPIAGYVVASSTTMPLPPATQGYDMQTLMKVPPSAVSGQTVTTPGGHQLPYYSTIYGKLLDGSSSSVESTVAITSTIPTTSISTNLLLADYLDTAPKSFSSLGSFTSHSTLFGALSSVNISTSTNEFMSTTTSTSPTSNDPASPVTDGSVSTRLQTTPLKMLTKTASHDPRLNPSLTAPEPPPAPKRKLSINEYRKRKQQSTDSNMGSPESGAVGGDSMSFSTSTATTPAAKSANSQGASLGATITMSTAYGTSDNVFDKAFDDCERRNSLSKNKIDDTPKVQFSPAPTLLEKQQESMSERLKSLKSKQASSAVSMGISSLLDSATSTLIGSTNHLSLHRDNYMSSTLNRTNSDLDNCLESISSSSTSLASSRESTPEPREHTSFNNISTTTTKSNVCSSTSSFFPNSTSATTIITATSTAITTDTTKVTSETHLSYSPILDTSADNFDSPIAESIEQQKAAASSPKQPDKIITDTDGTILAHGKKD